MKGKKKTPEEFKKEAQEVLGDRYLILSEYTGSNSYIEVYHRDCDTISRIRANHLLGGQRCKCERANPFSRKEVQERIRQINLKKHEVENVIQTRQTNLERYNVDNSCKVDITKDLLYDLYINKSMKRKDIANYLNLSELKVKCLLSKYNIKKDKDALKKTLVKVNIPKEDLYDLYINHNLNEKALSELYKVSISTIINKLKEYNITKSKEQRKLATIKYYMNKHEVEHPTKSKTVKEKQKQTNLEKYGVECTFQLKEVREKQKQTMLEKYGAKYPLQSKQIQEKIRQTNLKRYSVDNVFQNNNIKEKIKQTKLNRYGNENFNNRIKAIKTSLERYGVEHPIQSKQIQEKIEQTNLERHGVKYPAQSKEVRAKAIKTAKNTKSNIDDSKFDSSFERDVYDYCKRNNIEIEDRQVPIKYEYNGKEHTTFIDFKIDGYLIECKGSHLLEGVFDYKQEVPIEKKIEIYRKNHIIIVSNNCSLFPKAESEDSNGLKYLHKCPYPLIGIDIELFRNPEFPYRKDRPKCFYKVRVDNNPSALEAWSDETLRWKMIKNRIDYVGGFIDNKSILTAMNVTRICKQPSWFSKKFAKDLISKYITSDIILDPFAGWGTRCDAAKELNKKYYGWDLNKELVDWHHEKGRLFDTGCGIEYGDANDIKTIREECSVFICPPYTDYETYFEGQDLVTTQCEWLQIVMNNIPNAKEYLMVCKVVDAGFEQYVVGEKVNKSHLGTNKEYILLVPGK